MIKYLKLSAVYLIIICVTSLILATLNYFGVLRSEVINIIDTIIMVMLFIVLGYIHGKKSEKRGYVTGLKIGGILSFILFLLSLILFKNGFNVSSMIYYLILIISCVFGSMIGINKKSEN